MILCVYYLWGHLPMNSAQNPIAMTRSLTFLLALACGAIVASLYYSQTLIASIGNNLNMNLKLSGFIVTLTQLGYGAGLLFIAPLSDLGLIIVLLVLTFISLLGMIFSDTTLMLLTFCFLLGLTSASAQIIIPFVAHITPAEKRGQVVGTVMSGLLLMYLFYRFFPVRKPEHNLSYVKLITSFPMIFKSYPVFR